MRRIIFQNGTVDFLKHQISFIKKRKLSGWKSKKMKPDGQDFCPKAQDMKCGALDDVHNGLLVDYN